MRVVDDGSWPARSPRSGARGVALLQAQEQVFTAVGPGVRRAPPAELDRRVLTEGT